MRRKKETGEHERNSEKVERGKRVRRRSRVGAR
jgi:hypothetical protein